MYQKNPPLHNGQIPHPLAGVDVSLLEHIGPIEWNNVILFGEYVLNRELIQVELQ